MKPIHRFIAAILLIALIALCVLFGLVPAADKDLAILVMFGIVVVCALGFFSMIALVVWFAERRDDRLYRSSLARRAAPDRQLPGYQGPPIIVLSGQGATVHGAGRALPARRQDRAWSWDDPEELAADRPFLVVGEDCHE